MTSTLPFGGTTTTPASVLRMARLLSSAMRHLSHNAPLQARLIPDGKDALDVHLTSCGHSAASLRFRMAGRYGIDTPMFMLPVISRIEISVPDFVEALHFIGILLHDLNATVTDIGLRTRERNTDVLARPLGLDEDWGRMDRCDRLVPERDRGVVGPGGMACRVSAEGTCTSINAFNWACENVVQLAQRGIEPIGAHVWTRRRKPDLTDVHCESLEAQLVLDLFGADNQWRTHVFLAGSRRSISGSELVVPDLMQALHLVGMVLEGAGITTILIGRRARERNPHTVARPLRDWEREGEMVRASNVVVPLGENNV